MKDSLIGALWAGEVNMDVPPDEMDLDSYLQNIVQADLSNDALAEVPVPQNDDGMNELWVDPAAVEGLVRDDNGVVQVVAVNNAAIEANVVGEEPCHLIEEDNMPVVEEAGLIEENSIVDYAQTDDVEPVDDGNQQDGHNAVTPEELEMGERARVLLTPLNPEIIKNWTDRRNKRTVNKRRRRRESTREEQVGIQQEDLVKGDPADIAKWRAAAALDLCRLRLVSIPDADLNKYRKRQRLDYRALVEEAGRDEMHVSVTLLAEHEIERYVKKAEDAAMPKLTMWTDIQPSTSRKRNPPTLLRMKDVEVIEKAPSSVRLVVGSRLSGETEKHMKPKNQTMPTLENWKEVPLASSDIIPTLERMEESIPTVKFKTPEKLRFRSLSQPGTSRKSSNSDAHLINGDYSHNLLRLVTKPRRSIRKKRPSSLRRPFGPLTVNSAADKFSRTGQPRVVDSAVQVSRTAAVPAPETSFKSITFMSIDEYWNVVVSGDFRETCDFVQPNKIWSEPVQSLLLACDIWNNFHSPRIPEPKHFGKSNDFRPKKATRRCARVVPFKKAIERSRVFKNHEQVEVQWNKRELQQGMETEKHTQARTEIRNSPIHGKGIYTIDPIPRGAFIIEYVGEIIRSTVCDVREQKYLKQGKLCYFFTIQDTDLVIDATMKGNKARYINHSCQPNCRTKVIRDKRQQRIKIYAKRDIDANTELTYDYMFEPSEDQLPCHCGAKKCKKYI